LQGVGRIRAQNLSESETVFSRTFGGPVGYRGCDNDTCRGKSTDLNPCKNSSSDLMGGGRFLDQICKAFICWGKRRQRSFSHLGVDWRSGGNNLGAQKKKVAFLLLGWEEYSRLVVLLRSFERKLLMLAEADTKSNEERITRR